MTKQIAGFTITKKQEDYVLQTLSKLTSKKTSGVKMETVVSYIEYEAGREVDKQLIMLTICQLVKDKKVINLPRLISSHPDAEKVETAFYRLPF